MKPAEIATVVVAIPVIVALFAAGAAESRATAPVAATARAESPQPVFFDEIVVTAKRATKA
jgi:hypothetical protein